MVQSDVTPAIVAGVCDPVGLAEAGYNAAPIWGRVDKLGVTLSCAVAWM